MFRSHPRFADGGFDSAGFGDGIVGFDSEAALEGIEDEHVFAEAERGQSLLEDSDFFATVHAVYFIGDVGHGNPLCAGALFAAAVDVKLMVFHVEALGDEGGEVIGAAFHFEHTTAEATVKVVMMMLTRSLVALGFAGHIDGGKDAFIDKSVKGTIDGGESEVRHGVLGLVEDFLGG